MPLLHIAIFTLDTAAIEHSLCTPVGETLLGYRTNWSARSFKAYISHERMPPSGKRQAQSQRRQMSQAPRFDDRCVVCAMAWSWKAETKKDNP